MAPAPSTGRIVHYVSYGTPPGPDGLQAFESRCRAAVITEVDPGDPGIAGLCVLNPTGLFFNRNVPYHEDRHGGTWHWPERVD